MIIRRSSSDTGRVTIGSRPVKVITMHIGPSTQTGILKWTLALRGALTILKRNVIKCNIACPANSSSPFKDNLWTVNNFHCQYDQLLPLSSTKLWEERFWKGRGSKEGWRRKWKNASPKGGGWGGEGGGGEAKYFIAPERRNLARRDKEQNK